MRTDLSSPLMTEHQEVHREEHEKAAFDEQFERLEQELAEAEQVSDNIHDREEFARTAGRVKESMLVSSPERSEETTEKFQQLNFLKLMSSIHNRSVEISADGEKLVDREGQDVRDGGHLDSANDVLQSQPSYHDPVHDAAHDIRLGDGPLHIMDLPQSTKRAEVSDNAPPTNHLPDPLAHIKDGALPEFLDPLQAAKIVSGNQVKTRDWMPTDDDWLDMSVQPPRSIVSQEWQEMYDDYRHDDDHH